MFDFSQITNSQLFATVVTFLTANFGTLLIIGIKLISTKVKSLDTEKVIAKIEKEADIKLGEKYSQKALELQAQYDAKLEELYQLMLKKFNLDTEEKKAVVDDNTAKVAELTNEIKELMSE